MSKYPESLTEREALKILLACCDKLRIELADKWDVSFPVYYYLNRNMEWAREVLKRGEKNS